MKVRIIPSQPASCRIRIPGSKSIAHRYLIAAALAAGTSRLQAIPQSEDIEATMRVLRGCGAVFERDGDTTVVHGAGRNFRFRCEEADCGESGSTLRFLIPLLIKDGETVVFKGSGRLMERPLSVYETIFRQQGLLFEQSGAYLKAAGPLHAGEYRVKGNVSSQFISGLLFALPLLAEDSTIIVAEPFESAAYADLTVQALRKAGIRIEQDGCIFRVAGGQTYQSFDAVTDADDSQAVFFAVLAQAAGSEIIVENMPHVSLQADRAFLSVVERMGMHVTEQEQGYLFRRGALHGTEIDLSSCPDLGPALFALAVLAEGETVFRNAGRLRLKESDRIAAMEEELKKLGCTVSSERDTVYISGKTEPKGGVTLSSHRDHRIVMALSVLLSGAQQPCVIEGAEAVNKSYPGFFGDLSAAGVKTEEC